MTKHDWFIELGYEVAQAYQQHFFPALQADMESSDWEWPDLRYMQAAIASEEPLNADMLLQRGPYSAKTAVEAGLAKTAERGYLEAVEGGYQATDLGRKTSDTVGDHSKTCAAALDQVVGSQAAGLADKIEGIAAACLSGAECPTPNLTMSQSFSKPDSPALERARRSLNSMYGFRDDAHVAAFKAHGVDGNAWEAFSHVWGGNIWGDPIQTAAEAAEKFSFRGFEETDYATALDGLVERGWLSKDGDSYAMTDTGTTIRESTEAETNRLFFSPWSMDESGATELRGQMERLRDALNEVPVKAPA